MLLLANTTILGFGSSAIIITNCVKSSVSHPMAFNKSEGSDFAARFAGKFLLDGQKNVVFSPASIHAVVGLVAAGATGAILNQTLAFLNLKNKEELVSMYQNIVGTTYADNSSSYGPFGRVGPRLSFVNGVWLDLSMKLKEPFKEIACGAFKAFAEEVDFQNKASEVQQEVNSWVEKETCGLIKDILPDGSIDNSSRLIFANSIYFEGSWMNKFKKSLTKDDEFHTLDGIIVRVPFMSSWERQYISVFDGFKVLKLFYQQDGMRSFSMIIFLPDAKDGLKSLMERMGSEPRFLDKYIPVQTVKVGKFMLPKFKMSYELELSEDLKDMGLNLPFDQLGGLMNMVTNPIDGALLVVSRIFHKTFIEVDEKGTTASSATVALLRCGCAMNPPPEMSYDFVADHPFAFVMKEDNTNNVLFMGRVVNPLF